MSDEIKNSEIAQEESQQVCDESQNLNGQEDVCKDVDGKKTKKCKKAKKNLTPEQKKKRTAKALIITGCVVLALVIFFSGCAIASSVYTTAHLKLADSFDKVEYTDQQLKPTYDENLGYWTFTKPDGREFKILQLTDVHIGGGAFSGSKDNWAMNAVATMVRQTKPDLVVVTGDIAYPVPVQAGTFNNLNATRIFAKMMENLGVYWTFTFGNHDTELYSLYSRDQICKYYADENFKYCLFRAGFCDTKDVMSKDSIGFGNDMIVVKNSDGSINQSLVMFDSHSYTDGDYLGMAWKYDNIHQKQTDWYATEMDKLKAANNGKEVKNLSFFHIPLREFRDAWANVIDTTEKEHKAGNKDYAVKPGDKITTDRGTTELIYGEMHETDKPKNGVRTYGVSCGYGEDDLFAKGLAHGMQGVFCGHDHLNNFSVNYTPAGAPRSIRLTYSMSVDYLAYPGIFKQTAQRGCTVITLDAQGNFDCAAKNYYADFEGANDYATQH